jgi:hypothetical protein
MIIFILIHLKKEYFIFTIITFPASLTNLSKEMVVPHYGLN